MWAGLALSYFRKFNGLTCPTPEAARLADALLPPCSTFSSDIKITKKTTKGFHKNGSVTGGCGKCEYTCLYQIYFSRYTFVNTFCRLACRGRERNFFVFGNAKGVCLGRFFTLIEGRWSASGTFTCFFLYFFPCCGTVTYTAENFYLCATWTGTQCNGFGSRSFI